MVRALAWRIRGREFESRLSHFSQNQFFVSFPCLSFLFFLNFEVKQCANMYWKYDNTGFAMEKKPNFFIFQNGKYPTQGQNKTHCVVIKLSIQGTMLLSRWRWPCTLWQILYKREKERFVVLATLWKNDNSSCFWYTNSFNWKSNCVLIHYKGENGYPNFLFSYLLLIALYTYSTYIVWLKKIFCGILFSNFLTRDYFLFFVSSSSIADSGTVWLDTYIKIIVICRDIHRTLRKL